MEIGDIIKELDSKLKIIDKELKENVLYIYCEIDSESSKCKYCGVESGKVHSKYRREIADLPIMQHKVKLIIYVKKYICVNPKCGHKRFAEPLLFAGEQSNRTYRLDEYIREIGLKNSSVEAEKIVRKTHIDISWKTILRMIKKATKEISYEAANIGIDDFSLKKRAKYATIIVDNDKHKRIEVINSREQGEVSVVLKKFKKIKTVTRDFSITYKKAIEETHPKAKHIVDRFHIFKNLTENLGEYIKRTIKDRIKIVNMDVESDDNLKVLNAEQRAKVETAARKWELAKEIKRLKSEGNNNCEISRRLKICRPTVIKYLKMAQMPILPDNSIVDRYIPMIKELIIKDCKTDEIYSAIKSAGYSGKQSLLYSRLKGIRQEIKENTKYLNRSQLKKILYRPIEEIKDCELRDMIEKYLETNHELKKLTDMVRGFKEIIFSGKPRKLDSWLKKADLLAIIELTKFTNLIKSDIKAVKNAIIYQQYSNGLTEGFNNKTKVIKRIMYKRTFVK